MDATALADALREATITGAILLGPALITALIVGTLMSVLQAITQVQDHAISFVPKIVGVGFVVFMLLPWLTDYYVEYARDTILQIPNVVLGG